MNRRPKLTLVAPHVSPAEVAAVVGALERFMRETAPASSLPPLARRHSAWQRAALQEGVAGAPERPLW